MSHLTPTSAMPPDPYFVLASMNVSDFLSFQMMNFALKMMNFALKMMDSVL